MISPESRKIAIRALQQRAAELRETIDRGKRDDVKQAYEEWIRENDRAAMSASLELVKVEKALKELQDE